MADQYLVEIGNEVAEVCQERASLLDISLSG